MYIRPIDSIAIDPPPYVTVMRRKIAVARLHPSSAFSQRVFAEARGYLMHRRIPIAHQRLPSWPKRRLKNDGSHSRYGPPPPMPTLEQIDALFRSKPQPQPQPAKPRPAKPKRKRKPQARSWPQPKPKPARADWWPPSFTVSPHDLCFLLWSEEHRRGVTGPNLFALADGAIHRGFGVVTVYVAEGRQPVVMNHGAAGFDPNRSVFNCGRFDTVELLIDREIHLFLHSII